MGIRRGILDVGWVDLDGDGQPAPWVLATVRGFQSSELVIFERTRSGFVEFRRLATAAMSGRQLLWADLNLELTLERGVVTATGSWTSFLSGKVDPPGLIRLQWSPDSTTWDDWQVVQPDSNGRFRLPVSDDPSQTTSRFFRAASADGP